MSTFDALHFTQAFDNQGDDEHSDDDVVAEFEKLDEQLRSQGAQMVEPTLVPEQPFAFLKLPRELREQVYDDYFRAEVCQPKEERRTKETLMFDRIGWRCTKERTG